MVKRLAPSVSLVCSLSLRRGATVEIGDAPNATAQQDKDNPNLFTATVDEAWLHDPREITVTSDRNKANYNYALRQATKYQPEECDNEEDQMALTNHPDERARRAVIRAIDPLTELVMVLDRDPGDTDPDPGKVLVSPDNLFSLAFSRVGIDSDLLIGGFVTGLRHQIPELSAKIQQVFGNLKPGVQIGLVKERLASELRLKLAGGST